MRNRFYCAKTIAKNIEFIIQEHVMSEMQKDRALRGEKCTKKIILGSGYRCSLLKFVLYHAS